MILGLMRVKNEARWIANCVLSILPVCERVLVMDNHSTDGTQFLCASIPNVTVFDSPFSGVNEVRDKNWLLDKAMEQRPEWIVHIDGDEMLHPESVPELKAAMQSGARVLSLRIWFLWDSEDQVRVDGVYGDYYRQSAWRPTLHRFKDTNHGGKFHCGNVPIDIRDLRVRTEAALMHFGYLHKEDRIRKYEWYNRLDPGNELEDFYRHLCQGDIPEVPAHAVLKHGGPLKLEKLCRQASSISA